MLVVAMTLDYSQHFVEDPKICGGEGLVIDVGQQGDGCTFRLHPKSRRRLTAAFPEAQPLDSLYVSYDAGQQPESTLGSRWPGIAFLLTGLDESQIEQLGGFRVAEAASGRVLFSSRTQMARIAKI